MFPFGYFVPAMKNDKREPPERAQGLRLVFIGSLIKRKGIQTLVEAMKACHEQGVDVSLDVYGPGDESMLASTGAVRYRGVIPFGETQRVIARYDLLVLPSLYDGWGVVVNEALLQGVPALVSDQVGARALVEKSGAGAVVTAGDAVALAAYLKDLSLHADRLRVWKGAATAFRKYLMPEMAARYMYGCVLYAMREVNNKPENPWYMA